MSRANSMRRNTRRVARAELEMHRKNLRRRAVRIFGPIMILAACLSGLYLLNQAIRVSNWDIQVSGTYLGATGPGSSHHIETQIHTLMQSLENNDFWSTRPAHLRTLILASVTDVASVDIQRTLNGSVHLQAIARQPVGLWQNPQGTIFLVDSHGVAYRPVEANEHADLPMLRVSQSDITATCRLLQAIASSKPAYYARISEVLAQGEHWKINFSHRQQWLLSRSGKISNTISKVGHLLESPRWRSGYWRVDARMESRWFIRPATQGGII